MVTFRASNREPAPTTTDDGPATAEAAEPTETDVTNDVSAADLQASTPLPQGGKPNSLAGKAGMAALVAMKAVIVAVAIDASVRSDSPRYRGKAMRTRAIGYVGVTCLVPLAWRLLPNRDRYPLGLDLAISVPLLLDAGGNAAGVYQQRHVDDVVHLANGAIVAGVAGALVAPHVDEPWQAALAAAGIGITAQTMWELMEYVAFKFGARGMELTYEDTMNDMIESTVGAIIGGLFSLTRKPRSKAASQTGGRSVAGA
jgi:hypothetical protein